MVGFTVVVGCQRSGTTLMGQIVGAHPLAILIDENDGLHEWVGASWGDAQRPLSKRQWTPDRSASGFRRKLVGTYREIRRMASSWPWQWPWRATPTDPDVLFRRCCLSAMTKYRNPEMRFLENGSLRDHIAFVTLKAPNLTYAYSIIPQAFPGARIVYMYRDIRAVVASMMALNGERILARQLQYIFSSRDLACLFPDEVALLKQDSDIGPHVKMALVAKIKMSLAHQFRNNGLDVIDVKYEELVTQPEVIISHILKALGLPYAAECLHHEDIFQGVGPGRIRRDRAIDYESKTKWRDRLTPQQSDDIWNVVQDLMEPLGYAA